MAVNDSKPRPTPPPALLAEITAAHQAIAASDPASAGPRWGAMHKLLLKAKVDPTHIMHLVGARDLAGLDALVRSLRGEVVEVPSAPAEAPPSPSIDPDTMSHAMRAFRKRLKLTRLDHESRLGVGPLTSGRSHEVDAMIPPNEFPRAVWEALAEAGKLKRAGQGFYALNE